MKDELHVALFFSDRKPHRLAPTSILVVTNYGPGLGRTLRHRGFLSGPLALRTLTPLEKEEAARHYRFRMVFYDSWAELIRDEQSFLQEDAGIGNYFLSVCQACALDTSYSPKCVPHKAGQPAATDVLDLMKRPELDADFTPDELAAAEQQFHKAAA
ncbi:hypothetical protein KLP40_14905 [Hymenobacter sp. NST-14]|uniref:hypothetical protein n=1 Tax=Hymenobacter piscis TaxID=2839984 RepID=UPI001C00A188|nr:hypothetical protein [Hymenobacter piscis]MBT9394459.1 hypothetical protein [Hymenobacter piscis]